MLKLFAVVAVLIANESVFAGDARDEDIFGSSAPAKTASPEAEISKQLADTLQIGGRLEIRTDSGEKEGVRAAGSDFGQLKQADIYFDTRPNKNLRGFLRLRLTEAGGSDGSQGAPIGLNDPTTSCSANCLRTDIDEMWLKWDIANQVYATLGKQHVKWGSGHFWNPTDFTAVRVIDPLALFDRRLGTEMLKLHLPFEKQGYNLYAILEYAGASHIEQLSGSLRGEFAFGGIGEAALSLQMAAHAPLKAGIDISSAVGPLDIHSETAFTKRESQQLYRGEIDPQTGQLPTTYRDQNKWFIQSVAGIDYSFKYNADNSMTIGAEYFYNQLGYDDRDLELYSLVTGQSPAQYGGRQYLGAFINLHYPGSWTETQFFLDGLRNLSDKSSVVRLTSSMSLYKNAELQAFVGRCQGDYGEFCFRVPDTFKALANAPQVPSKLQQVVQNLPVKRTMTTGGLGLVLKF